MTAAKLAGGLLRLAALALVLAAPMQAARAQAPADIARQYEAMGKALEANDLSAAAAALDRIIAYARETFGPANPATLTPIETRAAVALAMSDPATAEKLYREALAGRAVIGAPPDEQIALDSNGLGQALDLQGRFAEAEPFYRRALEVRQKVSPPDSRELALSYNNLANNLASSGKRDEAEALFRKALEINLRREGPQGEAVAISMANLASMLADRGKYAEAEAEHRKVLAIRIARFGAESAEAAASYNAVGYALANQGRFAEAEQILRRSLAIRRAALGESALGTFESLGNLASVLQAQGKAGEAEEAFRRIAAGAEASYGADSPIALLAQGNLATALIDQARIGEALPILRRVLGARRRLLGPAHPETAKAALNLASAMESAGDILAAEGLLRESLAASRAALGEGHDVVGTSYNNLAENLMQQGRFEEAESLHSRALEIRRAALGEDHPDVADSLNNLAGAMGAQRRHAEARPLLERALEINRARFGEDSLRVASALNNLASNREELGENALATPLYQRALAIRRKQLGERHPRTALSLNNLGYNLYRQGKRREAVPLFEQARAIYLEVQGEGSLDALPPTGNLATTLVELGGADERALDLARGMSGLVAGRRQAIAAGEAAGEDSAARAALRARADALLDADPTVTAFITLTQVDWAVAARRPAEAEALKAEAFAAAQQISVSQAGQAMARTAARVAAGKGPLGELVARQQAAAAQVAALDRRYTAAVAQGDRAAADAASAEARARAEELAAIDAEIRRGFPDYATLIAPGVLSLDQVRARLEADEGLLFIQPSNGDLFSFAISRDGFAWHRAEQRQMPMKREVEMLLCQMDGQSCTAQALSALPKETAMEGQGHPAFARMAAYALYRDLVAPVEGALAGVSRLYVTAPGTLGRLPLEMLVTEPPAAGDDADPALLAQTPWLGARYAITVLPSVSTLRALQRAGRTLPKGPAFRGYGAPRLEGEPGAQRGGLTLRGVFRSGADGAAPIADPAVLRRLPPLPGTRTELIAMAEVLGAPTSAIRLDASASESAVRADRDLARARVVTFATHGLLPDELRGLSEPGLVLTPPGEPSAADDGVLTASEAGELALSADWVILSACNTAAGESSADSLSSLSRAFLYAGAGSLLASHWRVSDAATAVLTVETLRADAGETRARALQSAMRAVRTGKRADGSAVPGWTPDWAHPMMWAPFSIISSADD